MLIQKGEIAKDLAAIQTYSYRLWFASKSSVLFFALHSHLIMNKLGICITTCLHEKSKHWIRFFHV